MRVVMLPIRQFRAAFCLLLLLFLGCAGYTRRPAYDDMTREEMFRALSTHTWYDQRHVTPRRGMMACGTEAFSRLRLRADGTFDHGTLFEESEEPQTVGRWNFEKTGPRTGVLRMHDNREKSSRIALFAFVTDDRLVFRARASMDVYLRRLPALQPSPRTADDLPDILLPAEYAGLVDTKWELVDDYCPPQAAVLLDFLADGRVQKTLSTEACGEARKGNDGGYRYTFTFMRQRADGACVEDTPFTYEFRQREPSMLVGQSWVYQLAGELGRERFTVLQFHEPLENLIGYVSTGGGVPREMRLELAWSVPGGTLTIEEVRWEGRTLVVTRELARVPIPVAPGPGEPARMNVTLAPRTSSEPGMLRFSCSSPTTEKQFVAMYSFP